MHRFLFPALLFLVVCGSTAVEHLESSETASQADGAYAHNATQGHQVSAVKKPKEVARGSSTVLAPDYQVVARSPDPKKMFLGSPAMAKLPSGRYVVTYDLFDNDPRGCVVLTSDDGCRTWKHRATVDLMWASPQS